MHDLRMLPGGVPAVQFAFEIHGRRGDRAGLPDGPASDRQDESRRPARGDDVGGWNSRLRQRAELRRGLPQGNPADDGDRRGGPADIDQMAPRPVYEVSSSLRPYRKSAGRQVTE